MHINSLLDSAKLGLLWIVDLRSICEMRRYGYCEGNEMRRECCCVSASNYDVAEIFDEKVESRGKQLRSAVRENARRGRTAHASAVMMAGCACQCGYDGGVRMPVRL